MRWRIEPWWLASVLLSCGSPRGTQGEQATASPDARGAVEVHGSLRAMMHEGEVGPKAALQPLLQQGRVGVGALSGLHGEVTLDGEQLWLSRAEGDRVVTEQIAPGQATATSAALLVTARIGAWDRVVVERPVALAELGDVVSQAATERGLTGPVPFRVEGTVQQLHVHVIDGTRLPDGPSSHAAHRQAAIQIAHDEVPATLVGFWSPKHAGVFTHMGQTVHVHATIEAPLASGHVDAVTVPAGAVLWVPAS